MFDSIIFDEQVEYRWDPNPYFNVITNKTIANVYERNARQLGVEFTQDPKILSSTTGSTDMGNVSHVVPAIHPHFYIGGGKHPEHSLAFTEQSGRLNSTDITVLPIVFV